MTASRIPSSVYFSKDDMDTTELIYDPQLSHAQYKKEKDMKNTENAKCTAFPNKQLPASALGTFLGSRQAQPQYASYFESTTRSSTGKEHHVS